MSSSVKFGTSGLRGLSVDLEGLPSALFVTAFCRYLEEQGLAHPGDPILVGQDFRDSSQAIASVGMGAISSSGFIPVDCGHLPTPALCYYGLKRCAASIMITGSHIPADRNGIKFYLPDGEIAKSDEIAITAWAEQLSGQVRVRHGKGKDEGTSARKLFHERNLTFLPLGAFTGLKLGVYQHSTVARDLFVDVLTHYGAEVTPLGRSDSFIPVDTEAVSDETITLLKVWAAEGVFDAIISADGDGDRPLIADETGQPLKGDVLGLMASTFLGAEVVVTPVTSNSGIEKNGQFSVIRTKVGSPYVIEGMKEALSAGKSHVVGFEANGGFLTASPFPARKGQIAPLPTRDCLLPVLATLYLMVSRKKPLSSVVTDFKLPATASDRIKDYAQERAAALMSHLLISDDQLANFLKPVGNVASKSEIDGLRVTLDDGRLIHFRPSGNAPEMRCYVEADSDEAAEELLRRGLVLLEGF